MALALSVVGCPAAPLADPLVPERLYAPSVAGVVEAEERLEGNVVRLTLDGGREIEIDLRHATRVADHPQPDPGYLILYGEATDGPWYVAIAGNPSCFLVHGRAIDHGEFMVFEFGLRVPKAEGYDPGSASGPRYDSPRGAFCLNSDGSVTEYYE